MYKYRTYNGRFDKHFDLFYVAIGEMYNFSKSLTTYCTYTTRTLNKKTDRNISLNGARNANRSGETKIEIKELPFIGGGWAEEFWDLDESKLESSNPADIAGEGRAGGGVWRQSLDHTYTVSIQHILDTSIRKGHARQVSADMQHFISARCIQGALIWTLAGNKESNTQC